MADFIKLSNISEYNLFRGIQTRHPLITYFDLESVKPLPPGNYHITFYTLFYKEFKCGELKYGRRNYDYQEGTLMFLAPGQVVGISENLENTNPQGKALLFHPDLIKGTPLGKTMPDYSFFNYDVNEALHISEVEKTIVLDCFEKIQLEVNHAIDRHSKNLLTANIDLLLQYCNRFYERQFFTRGNVNQGIVEKFELLLNAYFQSEKIQNHGFPTVAFFAAELNLSPNYFGDVIKKATGMSPLEHIQFKMIDQAKEIIFDQEKSISQIAYELGFSYPQHFARLFKQKVGMSPNEYRNAQRYS